MFKAKSALFLQVSVLLILLKSYAVNPCVDSQILFHIYQINILYGLKLTYLSLRFPVDKHYWLLLIFAATMRYSSALLLPVGQVVHCQCTCSYVHCSHCHFGIWCQASPLSDKRLTSSGKRWGRMIQRSKYTDALTLTFPLLYSKPALQTRNLCPLLHRHIQLPWQHTRPSPGYPDNKLTADRGRLLGHGRILSSSVPFMTRSLLLLAEASAYLGTSKEPSVLCSNKKCYCWAGERKLYGILRAISPCLVVYTCMLKPFQMRDAAS